MNIEIITLNNTNLKETGFGSALACNDVCQSLSSLCHDVVVTSCVTLNDLENVVKRQPDLVVLAAKYLPIIDGENIWFSEFFASNHIAFSGSDRETLKYDSNKVFAKSHLASLNIKTARFFNARPEEYLTEAELPLLFLYLLNLWMRLMVMASMMLLLCRIFLNLLRRYCL